MPTQSTTRQNSSNKTTMDGFKSTSDLALIADLNDLLANEYALFTKTLSVHWNVTGPQFYSVHKMLDDQYHQLLDVVDDIAERIRMYDGRPMSTLSEMNSTNEIKEEPALFPDMPTMLEGLVKTHNKILDQIKTSLNTIEAYGKEPGAEDMLVSILKKHEMMVWQLKSHLQ